MTTAPLLTLAGVGSGYGSAQVLFDVDMTLSPGEVTTLMGRNGMGKTTTVRSILGQLPLFNGRISFRGERIDGMAPHQIARLGIGLVPEGRQVFPNLTVRENLHVASRGAAGARNPWNEHRVLEMFPRLAERLGHFGNHLSGGEQQMLAIGRALMTNPTLIVFDEATEGLAPLLRDEIWRCIASLRDDGLAVLVIDKNVAHLARIANRHYVIERGRIVWHGNSSDLLAATEIRHRYLGV
jgi:branched-chain amino acid transport system ATP-binding protein